MMKRSFSQVVFIRTQDAFLRSKTYDFTDATRPMHYGGWMDDCDVIGAWP